MAYIDDEIFMSPHYYSSEDKEISLMMCDDGNGMCGIGYREINRLTGKFRSLNISIPNKKVIEFNNKNSFRSLDDFFIGMRDFIDANGLQYIHSYSSGSCKKSKKAF